MLLTAWLPLVAVLLVQPPDAAHDAALVELQVNVELPPLAMVVGLAISVTVGGRPTVTVAEPLPDPPTPVQVIV